MAVIIPRNIYKTSLILFFIGLLGYAFNFLFNALLASYTDSVLFGEFSVAFRVLNLVSVGMLLGSLGGVKRFYSQYIKHGMLKKASRYIAWNIRLFIIASCFLFFVLLLLTIVVFWLHLIHVHDIREYHLIIHFLWLAPINAVALLISAYLICDRDVYLGTFFDASGFYLFGLGVLCLMIYAVGVTLHREMLLIFVLGILIVMVLIESFILINRIPTLLRSGFSSIFNGRKGNLFATRWWVVSKRLILNQIIYFLIRSADLFLLAILSPDKKIVGYYAAALTMVGVFQVTQTSLFQLPTSFFSALLVNQSDRPRLQTLINKANLTNIVLHGFLVAGMWIGSEKLLSLFGAGFIVVKTPLLILLCGVMISVIAAPAARLLAYSGNELCLIYITIIEMVIMLFSGWWLIVNYGAIGAAWAVVLTSLFRSIASVYYVRSRLAIRCVIIV